VVSDERPWVGVTAYTVKEDIGIGSRVPTLVLMKNSGKSTALNIVHIIQLTGYCGGLPEHPTYQPKKDSEISSSALIPDQEMWTDVDTITSPLTREQFEQLQRPDCRLYLYGTIKYRDSFGNAHWRHHCRFWVSGTPRQFNMCSGYNDGDEDYKNGKEP
jgi:hypothetical protein